MLKLFTKAKLVTQTKNGKNSRIMKPTKLLIELDERNMEICKEVMAISETIRPRSECSKTTSKRMQHKVDELFKWLDTILEWATLHEREWMRELDAKLNTKNDPYFSDYELHIKQYGKKSDNDEFDTLFKEIIDYMEPCIWVDHGLVFSEALLSDKEYKCHLDWRRNEKVNNLSQDISYFNSVTTSFEITHQYIVQLKAGKWHKVNYDAKRFGKDGKVKRLKDEAELPC